MEPYLKDRLELTILTNYVDWLLKQNKFSIGFKQDLYIHNANSWYTI